MVVDSNFLQSPKLRDYLLESTNNFAVLTEYASIEAHKGNTLVSVFRSMGLLADFPRQVIVLKPTIVARGLRGRRREVQHRLIDHQQTRDFPEYCDHLLAAKLGDVHLRDQILRLGRDADAEMARVLGDAISIPVAIEALAEIFTDAELKVLRTGSPFSESLASKVVKSVLLTTRFLFSQQPNPAVVYSFDDLLNTFLFRTALCSIFWALDWISVAGPGDIKPEKMLNDLVDLNFATFATYFDGLLSMDTKAKRIYQIAAILLDSYTIKLSDK